MMKKSFVILVVFGISMVSGYGHANSIDDSLNKAKAEGKSVMLELGSVGCKHANR